MEQRIADMVRPAVRALKAGRLVAFPTETVYGLGADATNPQAVARIFAAKGRPATNPLIVHVADLETAKRYAAEWNDAAQALAEACWPGPLAVVVPKKPAIVDLATAGRPTVALRVPDHPLALRLLQEFGGPVAAPSANKSNHVSPTTARHVRDELGDAVDVILDGGPCAVGIESTVVDLTGKKPLILRPGGVPRRNVEAIVGPVEVFAGAASPSEAAASPGLHDRHYAPRTPAFRFETSQRGLVRPESEDGGPNGIVLVGGTDRGKRYGPVVEMPRVPEAYAAQLYATLRDLDDMGVKRIYVEMPPDVPSWEAVRDRIRRATRALE